MHTLPGHSFLNTTLEIYGSEEAFAEDVIKAYGEFVQEIYAAGCRNLQFDDCVWGGMVDAKMASCTDRKNTDRDFGRLQETSFWN